MAKRLRSKKPEEFTAPFGKPVLTHIFSSVFPNQMFLTNWILRLPYQLADLIDHPTCRNSADPYDGSSKQRHDAVDELRRAAAGEYRHVDALDVIAGAVGVSISGKYMHDAEETVYAVLAGLIDRPTCEDVSDFDHEAFKCSRCGHRVLSLGGDSCDAVVVSPDGLISEYHYCPNCGKEVVE